MKLTDPQRFRWSGPSEAHRSAISPPVPSSGATLPPTTANLVPVSGPYPCPSGRLPSPGLVLSGFPIRASHHVMVASAGALLAHFRSSSSPGLVLPGFLIRAGHHVMAASAGFPRCIRSCRRTPPRSDPTYRNTGFRPVTRAAPVVGRLGSGSGGGGRQNGQPDFAQGVSRRPRAPGHRPMGAPVSPRCH